MTNSEDMVVSWINQMLSVDDVDAFIDAEIAKWSRVIRSANVTLQ